MRKITKHVRLISIFLSALIALSSGGAFAETNNGFYLGAGVGEVDIDTDGFDDPTGFEFIAGFNINENFSLEASYIDFGDASDNVPPSWEIEADSIAFGVLGKIPLSSNLELFAKLGYHSWDAEISEDGFGSFGDDDGSDIFYGVGATYNFENGLGLGIRYNSYSFDVENDDSDVSMISANIQYRFN